MKTAFRYFVRAAVMLFTVSKKHRHELATLHYAAKHLAKTKKVDVESLSEIERRRYYKVCDRARRIYHLATVQVLDGYMREHLNRDAQKPLA